MESLDCSSTWMAATLSDEGLITGMAPGTERFIGYSAYELAGQPITRILDDESVFEMPAIIGSANEWGCWQGEIGHKTREGKVLRARGTLSLLAGASDGSSRYFLLSNLSKSSALADGADPFVNEVARNLRTFAHDLNNPLAVMMGFAQLLMMNGNCQGGVRDDLEKMYSELKRVIQVVERLHSYAMSLYTLPRSASING